MAEKNYPPQPEPLKEGETWPTTHKAAKHDHRWQGFRGGEVRTVMCVICGQTKDTEVVGEVAPAPEPVKKEE